MFSLPVRDWLACQVVVGAGGGVCRLGLLVLPVASGAVTCCFVGWLFAEWRLGIGAATMSARRLAARARACLCVCVCVCMLQDDSAS